MKPEFLLAYIVTDKEFWIDYKDLVREIVDDAQLQKIVHWVEGIWNSEHKLPSLKELNLKFGVSVEHVDRDILKREIENWILGEKVKRWILNTAERLDRGMIDVDRLLIEAKSLSQVLSREKDTGVSFRDKYREILSRLVDADSEETISTGLRRLDDALGSGFKKKEIAVLIAPPGWGKTMWLLHCMYWALVKRHNVLFVSLELPLEIILERFYRRITLLSRKDMRLNLDEAKARIERFLRYTKSEGRIVHYKAKTFSVHDLELFLDRESARGINYDLVLIDYLDKMKSYGRDFRIALRDLTEDLRYLAVERNIAIVTATQANRLSLSATVITEEHVSESFGKVEVADVILSLCRSTRDEDKNRARLVLLKNRNYGNRGVVVPIKIDFDRSLMEDL